MDAVYGIVCSACYNRHFYRALKSSYLSMRVLATVHALNKVSIPFIAGMAFVCFITV